MAKKAQKPEYACTAMAKKVGGRCRQKEDGEGDPRYCKSHRSAKGAEPVPIADRYLLRFTLNPKWEDRIRDAGIEIITDRQGQSRRNLGHEKQADGVDRDFQAYRGKPASTEAKGDGWAFNKPQDAIVGDSGSLVFDPCLQSADVEALFATLMTGSGLALVEIDAKAKMRHGEIKGFTLTLAFMPEDNEVYAVNRGEASLLKKLTSLSWGRVFIYDNPTDSEGQRKVTINCTGPSEQKPKTSLKFAGGLFDYDDLITEEVAA